MISHVSVCLLAHEEKGLISDTFCHAKREYNFSVRPIGCTPAFFSQNVDLLYSIRYTIIGDYMDVLKVFSHNVRRYRTQLGLSQETVAFRTGLHRTYISAVERGKRSISLDNIQKIADALEVETYLLFIDDIDFIDKAKKGGSKSCRV